MNQSENSTEGSLFVQYSNRPLYVYPSLSVPTLLYWCTARTLPSSFSIVNAWNEAANVGCFLFVDNPETNRSQFSAIVTKMKLPQNKPEDNEQGFLWLNLSNGSLQNLTCHQGTVEANLIFSEVSDSGIPQLILKKDAPVTLGPDSNCFNIYYPTGIPNANPPEANPSHPIVLNLLGENAGRFLFKGFAPSYGYYYLYNVTIDPLNAQNCQKSLDTTFAMRLVPTQAEPPAPAYKIEPIE